MLQTPLSWDFMQAILYEDNYLIALNKPAGMRAEENPGLESEVATYLKSRYPWKKQLIAGLAHRLDRLVSGVMLFAITPMALKDLGKQFENRTVQKTYLAICTASPPAPSGELNHWLLKDSKNRKAIVSKKPVGRAQPARLRYKLLMQNANLFLLEIELLTGRYHQIRAQLAEIGVPIVGDEKYGSTFSFPEKMIGLHASRLTLQHPKSGGQLTLTAPLPEVELWKNW